MSSGDKGVQGLQYLNFFSYSLKFLLLNVSLFYLKQDKRAFYHTDISCFSVFK